MDDLFKDTAFGKAALAKIKPTSRNFMLYNAGIADEHGTMDVTGAEFRAAAAGPRKGEICILVPGTIKKVYVSRAEIEACK
jgi:hypothetical protein